MHVGEVRLEIRSQFLRRLFDHCADLVRLLAVLDVDDNQKAHDTLCSYSMAVRLLVPPDLAKAESNRIYCEDPNTFDVDSFHIRFTARVEEFISGITENKALLAITAYMGTDLADLPGMLLELASHMAYVHLKLKIDNFALPTAEELQSALTIEQLKAKGTAHMTHQYRHITWAVLRVVTPNPLRFFTSRVGEALKGTNTDKLPEVTKTGEDDEALIKVITGAPRGFGPGKQLLPVAKLTLPGAESTNSADHVAWHHSAGVAEEAVDQLLLAR